MQNDELADTVKLSKEFLYFRNDFAMEEVQAFHEEVYPMAQKFKRAMY